MVTQEHPRAPAEQDWRPRPTLAGADYSSAAVYDEERERLFFGGWVCIARSGVYPRKDRLLFDFNERWRKEMGRPLLG